ARSSTASRFAQFGDLVDVPAQGQEEGVFIFLHGFGDSARGFASQLPNLLQMPQMRYVLPTAPSLGGTAHSADRGHVHVEGNIGMRSWFTPAALGGGGESVAVKESVEYVHELIRQEITRGVRPGQIFVGGFSQGGCVAVRAALSFPDASLGGAVAASTFLSMSRSPEAVSIAEPNRRLPVLGCHGDADGAVPSLAGKQLVEQLRNQGVPAEFKSYPTMGHAYCPEEPAKPPFAWKAQLEARDVVSFLTQHLRKSRPDSCCHFTQELKALLLENGVSTLGCFEKWELLERAKEANL
ncbi:unnamed protein product, partial [Durusdinium trenchii]